MVYRDRSSENLPHIPTMDIDTKHSEAIRCYLLLGVAPRPHPDRNLITSYNKVLGYLRIDIAPTLPCRKSCIDSYCNAYIITRTCLANVLYLWWAPNDSQTLKNDLLDPHQPPLRTSPSAKLQEVSQDTHGQALHKPGGKRNHLHGVTSISSPEVQGSLI